MKTALPKLMNQKSPLWLVMILLFATLLRVINLGKYSLAGDELYSQLVSNFMAQEGAIQPEFRKAESPYFTSKEVNQAKHFDDFLLAVAYRDNGSGALYAYISHYWQNTFGPTDAAVRSLPLLINLLSILLLYWFVCKHLGSQKIALLSAFLMAISPFMVAYSQTHRTYSLVFLLALWATHLLLNFLQQKKTSTLILYGIMVLLSMMAHYAVFVIYLFHGLFVLLYHRNLKTISLLVLSMLIPAAGVLWWLNSTGGQWAMHSITESKKVYNQIAIAGKDPNIQLSTVKTVFLHTWQTFSLSFIALDAVAMKWVGLVPYLAFTLLLGINIGFAKFYKAKNNFVLVLFAILSFGLTALILNQSPVHFLSPGLLALLVYNSLQKNTKAITPNYVLVAMIGIGSVLMLVLFAYMDGNTMRIIPRYSGYGYAFGCILVAALIFNILQSQNKALMYLLYCFLISQGLIVGKSLYNIFQDRGLPYFHALPAVRIGNPYHQIAKSIMENYQAGDVVVFPSKKYNKNDPGYNMPAYSVQDAQYVNIYLKNWDKEAVQMVNPAEENLVILKKKSGEQIIIFDFKNGTLRY